VATQWQHSGNTVATQWQHNKAVRPTYIIRSKCVLLVDIGFSYLFVTELSYTISQNQDCEWVGGILNFLVYIILYLVVLFNFHE
jgi:hypothetical protein